MVTHRKQKSTHRPAGGPQLLKPKKQPEHLSMERRPPIVIGYDSGMQQPPFMTISTKKIYVRAQSGNHILSVPNSDRTEKPQNGIDCGGGPG